MNVLITGGRSPYTLDLIRMFGKAGHEVFVVEFFSVYLSRFSKHVHRSFIITAPNENFERFEDEFLGVLRTHKIDLVLPTCEEIFHLAKIRDKIEVHAKAFFEDFPSLKNLHDKYSFIKMLEKKAMEAPKTFLLSDYHGELKGKKVVLKKVFSRFASNVHIIPESGVDSLLLDKKEWVIQEFIPGLEISLYVVLNEGKVGAYSAYSKSYAVNGGATTHFKHFADKKVEVWINRFFEGTHYTGQFSFDLIIDQAGVIFPIECNPRGTSGIHLFSGNEKYIPVFFGRTELLTPALSSERMLGLAMLVYGFSFKKRKDFVRDFKASSDVIFSKDDILPFFTQFITFGYFILLSLWRRVKVIEITTADIEYNG